jgi:phosphoesterase RecJ-like protein
MGVTLQEPGFLEYIGVAVVILGHHNADPDAVGSAQGVKELIERLKTGTVTQIVMPDDISKLSRKLIQELELDVREKSSIDPDTIVIVDSGGLNQLGSWENIIRDGKYVLILVDHHTLDNRLAEQVDLLIHDETASSTSEIMYQLFRKHGVTPTVKTSKALLAGIAFDTKFLSIGGSETFETVSMLLKEIKDVSEIREMMHIESDLSERIARLKAGQRSDIRQIGEWVIVFSELGSFQASGARALISLGADLAIVVGSEKNETRISLRATQGFYDETGIHLGELVSWLGSEYGGFGSGHPTAAGYNGSVSYDALKSALLGKINSLLG